MRREDAFDDAGLEGNIRMYQTMHSQTTYAVFYVNGRVGLREIFQLA